MVLVLWKFLFGIAMMNLHNYLASCHHRDTDNNEFRNLLVFHVYQILFLISKYWKSHVGNIDLKFYLTLVISTKHVILIHILANCHK